MKKVSNKNKQRAPRALHDRELSTIQGGDGGGPGVDLGQMQQMMEQSYSQ